MGKYLMVVTSAAKDGRDDEYNAWYDGTHLADILALPGVTSGKRYDAAMPSPHPHPNPYLTIYELEVEDPGAVVAEMFRRGQAGEMSMTDSVDRDTAQIWIYKAH